MEGISSAIFSGKEEGKFFPDHKTTLFTSSIPMQIKDSPP